MFSFQTNHPFITTRLLLCESLEQESGKEVKLAISIHGPSREMTYSGMSGLLVRISSSKVSQGSAVSSFTIWVVLRGLASVTDGLIIGRLLLDPGLSGMGFRRLSG